MKISICASRARYTHGKCIITCTKHPSEGAFLFGGKNMLIAFEIVLMIAMLILTIGAIAEQKKELRMNIQYILLIDTLVLTVLFLFAN